MRLNSLKIERIEGFQHKGFGLKKEHLASDITMIIGPNGSGKSTICKAITALLWPKSSAAETMLITGVWEDQGQQIEMKLNGRDHQTIVEDPSYQAVIPSFHLSPCYVITLDDLFDAKDHDLARDVYRQARGGYDLSSLHQDPELTVGKFLGKQERHDLQEVKNSLNRLQSNYEQLLHKELNLDQLKKQIQHAKEAGNALSIIDEILNLQETRNEEEESLRLRDSFSPLFARLAGDEDSVLETAEKKLEGLQIEQRKAEESRAHIDAELNKIGFYPRFETLFPQFKKLNLSTLERLEKERDSLQKRLLEIENNVLFTANFLGLDFSFFKQATHKEINALYTLWKRGQKYKEQETALKSRLATFQDNFEYSSEDLLHAIELILQLSAHKAVKTKEGIGYGVAILFALFLGLVDPFLSLTAALPGLIWLYFVKDRSNEISRIKHDLEALPIPFRHDLKMLYDALGKSALSAVQKTVKNELEFQLKEVEHQHGELYRSFENAREDSHFDYEEHIGLLFERFNHAFALTEEHDQKEKELAQVIETCSESLETINRFYRELSLVPVGSFEEGNRVFQQLTEQFEGVRTLVQKKTKELDSLKNYQTVSEIHAQEKKRLFTRLGVESITVIELKQLLKELPAYRSAVQNHHRLKEKREYLFSKVKEYREWLELGPVDLKELKIAMEAKYGEHDALLKVLHDTQKDIERTSASEELQTLELEHRLAQEKLQNKYEKALEVTIATSLLESIEQEYRSVSQSPLLKKASEWFVQFTHGAYELRMGSYDQEQLEFFAFDTKQEELKPLNALSRGTRIQLLLAVRLAFSEINEDPDHPLPFFFDEAFSNFDLSRFEAVCDALTQIAQKGRQIIYFSCRPEEAVLWKTIMARFPELSLQCLDLEKIKTSDDPTIQLELQPPVPVVDPTGLSLAEYASHFEIKGLQSAENPHNVDVYHLVSSAEELSALYRSHVKTYGQLKSWIGYGKTPFQQHQIELLQTKGNLLEHYFRLKKIGEGKKLNRSALEKSGISSKFIDPISDLAASYEWNTRLLFSELSSGKKIKRLQENTVLKSKIYMIEQGYLDEREPLSSHELEEKLFQFSKNDLEQNKINLEELTRFISLFKIKL